MKESYGALVSIILVMLALIGLCILFGFTVGDRSGYVNGYNAGIQDVMSGRVHPKPAATQWVVEQPEKQQ